MTMAQAARAVRADASNARRAPVSSAHPRKVAVSETAPILTVIHGGQGRYMRAVVVSAVAIVTMLGAVAGRAHMAEQQIRLDRLSNDVRRARAHFDSLRAERAELQSPDVLIAQARSMGLVPSLGNRVVSIPADLAASVVATVGVVDADIGDHTTSALDEVGRIKSTVGGD